MLLNGFIINKHGRERKREGGGVSKRDLRKKAGAFYSYCISLFYTKHEHTSASVKVLIYLCSSLEKFCYITIYTNYPPSVTSSCRLYYKQLRKADEGGEEKESRDIKECFLTSFLVRSRGTSITGLRATCNCSMRNAAHRATPWGYIHSTLHVHDDGDGDVQPRPTCWVDEWNRETDQRTSVAQSLKLDKKEERQSFNQVYMNALILIT